MRPSVRLERYMESQKWENVPVLRQIVPISFSHGTPTSPESPQGRIRFHAGAWSTPLPRVRDHYYNSSEGWRWLGLVGRYKAMPAHRPPLGWGRKSLALREGTRRVSPPERLCGCGGSYRQVSNHHPAFSFRHAGRGGVVPLPEGINGGFPHRLVLRDCVKLSTFPTFRINRFPSLC